MSGAAPALRALVAAIAPLDAIEARHRAEVLAWLGATDDVYRRLPPRTPPQHLAAYALLHDPSADAVLLLEHRLSGLLLPAGGHVDVGEDPAHAAAREAYEELGLERVPTAPRLPLFLSVTETTGSPAERHIDVALWYVFAGDIGWSPVPDPREADGARWWTRAEVTAADPARFDPHLGRVLARLDSSTRPSVT